MLAVIIAARDYAKAGRSVSDLFLPFFFRTGRLNVQNGFFIHFAVIASVWGKNMIGVLFTVYLF